MDSIQYKNKGNLWIVRCLKLHFFMLWKFIIHFFCSRPLEDAVSKWQFKLRATDSANESVVETVDIAVQQHKAHRSANHEISIGIKLNEKFASNIDWQIQLIRGLL